MIAAGVLLPFSILSSDVSAATECSAGPAESWLAGRWGSEKTTVVIRHDGDGLHWTYERIAGLATEAWGIKAPAKAVGRVVTIDGCTAHLEGVYTEYGGIGNRGRPAVGSPMRYTVELKSPRLLVGEGLGYGLQPFPVTWRKTD